MVRFCLIDKHQCFESDAATGSQWRKHTGDVEELGKVESELCSCILVQLKKSNGTRRQICHEGETVV